jgi:glycosyltransferase involved in cell wall biosynthesis
VPVIASDIPGNTGILGRDWPALFAPGDTMALAELLRRLATDAAHRAELERRTRALAPLVTPDRERALWLALLRELGLPMTEKRRI